MRTQAAAAAMGLEMPTDEAMTEFLGKEPDTGAKASAFPLSSAGFELLLLVVSDCSCRLLLILMLALFTVS